MGKFYAYVRECYKNRGPYREEVFTSCSTKEEVKELCRQSNYIICSDSVYTEKEWEMRG